MKLSTGMCATALLVATGTAIAHDASGFDRKTREQARAELAQAYEDGLLPHKHNDYPPSAAGIQKNKEAYARAHPEQSADASSDAVTQSPSATTRTTAPVE